MKRKIVWLVLSCLVALSLVLAACAPAVTEKKEVVTEKEVTKEAAVTKEPVVTKEVTPAAEKPKYGGQLIVGTEIRYLTIGYDQVYLLSNAWWPPLNLTHDELVTGDWAKGAAGTGEASFTGSEFSPLGIVQHTGSLATSWEIPDDQTMIFKIRQGVHFWNKPPVNGRELTAQDVAFSINRLYSEGTLTPNVADAAGGHRLVSATATDKWTVVVKVTGLAQIFFEDVGDKLWIIAPESIAKYGDTKDWRNVLGTGPFMLTDVVTGSSLGLVRNPNYWMKDPVGPGKGNQLPYLDRITYLIMPDKSTQHAALRTGKIDHLYAIVNAEDLESLLRYNPALKSQKKLAGFPMTLITRSSSTSPQAAPLMKKRVRQALAMAIDHPGIIKDFYKGKADLHQMLFFSSSPYYTKLEDMDEILEQVHGFSPEEVKIVEKMYGYYPAEAKKILAEEGYPNGFSTIIMTTAENVDRLSIVAEYWRKNLNVDLKIDIKEVAASRALSARRQFDAMITGFASMAGWPERWQAFGPSTMEGPRSLINMWDGVDPVINGAATRFEAVYGDYEARNKIIKETEPYMLQTGWWIHFPAAWSYWVWQPWLKNYHGEDGVGYRNRGNWPIWAWLDQDLKKAMGY